MIQTHFADVGDVTLHYATAGTGPALVLFMAGPRAGVAGARSSRCSQGSTS